MLNVVQILSRDILERNLATILQRSLPGFGTTIMGSLLVQQSAGCQTLTTAAGDTGIPGDHKTADEFRFALQPAFTVQVPQVPKSLSNR